MASASHTALRSKDHNHALGVPRLFVAGGATATIIFVLCWVGAFIPFSSPTHAYISLFSSADTSSGRALMEGALWSLLFGSLVGGLFALVYNATAPLGRK